ncbi:unnamed protein product [Adineta steineri]|uniref:Peptidase S1 domain-containing protein n=1 Tax=Adineta steineri TaxID=433720 RepID=A0A813VCB4_9BILA|nr:unnamed protein product [Adineta steineri]CAF3850949.1 unnamed protein product [Adineta steineri]
MKIVCLILLIFSLFDVTTSTKYECNRRATCGCSKWATASLSRIIGGEPVNVTNPWGWIGSLRKDGFHQCGATLISPMHAITAAHCVKYVRSLSSLSLMFGITNLTDIGELRKIVQMYIHPSYDQTSSANDLAILRLDSPINLIDSNVSRICLPSSYEFDLSLAEYPPVASDLVAIGWGVTEPFSRIPSPVLRQVTVQAISRNDQSCANTINDDTVQFCAGSPEGGKDTCQGDSGGPLMLFKDRRWQLVGITSYGDICGSPEHPGVYTRVAFYISYINQIIDADFKFTGNTKQLTETKSSRANSITLYETFIIQLFSICLYLVHKKVFYQN